MSDETSEPMSDEAAEEEIRWIEARFNQSGKSLRLNDEGDGTWTALWASSASVVGEPSSQSPGPSVSGKTRLEAARAAWEEFGGDSKPDE